MVFNSPPAVRRHHGYVIAMAIGLVTVPACGSAADRGATPVQPVTSSSAIIAPVGGPMPPAGRISGLAGTPGLSAIPPSAPVSLTPDTRAASTSGVSPSPSASSAPTSAPFTSGVRTLVRFEHIALAAALNPAKATLAWAETLTVAQLRAQGVDSVGLPDATPMFIVAVNGDALVDGSVRVKDFVVHRYALIRNSLGTVPGNAGCYGDFCGLTGPAH